MLTSIIEYARHTRLYYTRHKSYFNVSPNWGLMESNGLAHMGILFPEFAEAKDWQCEAMSWFEEQIRMQLCREGMQVERASGYHLVCTFCFMQILDLALRNRVRVSDTYKQNAQRMIDFVVSIMKPHGVYPMLKDADESDVFHDIWAGKYGGWAICCDEGLADPGFKDPTHGDLRLSEDGPASQIGFKPFPLDKAGPR